MEWWGWVIVAVVVLAIIGSVDKAKKKKKKEEIIQRIKEAENFIFSSGDPKAIQLLMLARANPSNYTQILSGGMNTGNDSLKTALGVMAGVVVGNQVSSAIAASTISSALADFEKELSALDMSSADFIHGDVGGAGVDIGGEGVDTENLGDIDCL